MLEAQQKNSQVNWLCGNRVYLSSIAMITEFLGSSGFLEQQYAGRHSTGRMRVNLEVVCTVMIHKTMQSPLTKFLIFKNS
jgi:hypothetical protein